MKKRMMMLLLAGISASVVLPSISVAQAPQGSDATMIQTLPPGMRLSKEEVYSMYLSAIRNGSVEKTSGEGTMIFIMAGKGMSKTREQVLKELMNQTPEQKKAANKP